MTEMFGEAWSPMSVPDLAPDDDDIRGEKIVRAKVEVLRELHSPPPPPQDGRSLKVTFKRRNLLHLSTCRHLAANNLSLFTVISMTCMCECEIFIQNNKVAAD